MQKISCCDNSNTVNTNLKSCSANSKTVCETNCTFDNETFSSDLINLKEEAEAEDDENSLQSTNDNTNINKSVNNFIRQNNRKNYKLSSSSSVSSSSSSSSTSISPVPFSYLNTKKQLKKYHHHFNQQNLKLNYNRCICKLDQKQFDCFQCTQNYPINVRRSKDGEEEHNYFYSKNDTTNLDQINCSNDNNKMKVLFSSMDNEAASDSSEQVVFLKPSPIPVSSSLLSLLALTKPSNTFVPPPNKCLVQSHLFGKNSSSSSSTSHSNKN